MQPMRKNTLRGKNKMENKIVNLFENAIQLDHLNLKQLEELEKILDKIK
jgi:hypothetical protein